MLPISSYMNCEMKLKIAARAVYIFVLISNGNLLPCKNLHVPLVLRGTAAGT